MLEDEQSLKSLSFIPTKQYNHFIFPFPEIVGRKLLKGSTNKKERAVILHNHSIALEKNGKRAEALTASIEAV